MKLKARSASASHSCRLKPKQVREESRAVAGKSARCRCKFSSTRSVHAANVGESHHLGFDRQEIVPFNPPTTIKTPPRTKHEVDRITRYGDMAIRNSTYDEGCIWDPHFEGKGRRGSRNVPLERAMVVPMRSPRDHYAICNHSAAICHRMSPTHNTTAGGSLWVKILGCSLWSRSVTLGSAESEHPLLKLRKVSCQRETLASAAFDTKYHLYHINFVTVQASSSHISHPALFVLGPKAKIII